MEDETVSEKQSMWTEKEKQLASVLKRCDAVSNKSTSVKIAICGASTNGLIEKVEKQKEPGHNFTSRFNDYIAKIHCHLDTIFENLNEIS